MNEFKVIQGSPEWLSVRIGNVTASRVADVMTKLVRKDGEAACRMAYRAQVVAETLTGRSMDQYVSPEMEWGTENEPLARTAYELTYEVDVKLAGFFFHPKHPFVRAGASPDGLVGKDGMVQFKCPKTTTHLNYMVADVVPKEYQDQMLLEMACAERQWCDFVSFDPRLPEEMQLFCVRFHRDDKLIAEMEKEIGLFISEVDQTIAWLKDRVGAQKAGKTLLQVNLERSVQQVSL